LLAATGGKEVDSGTMQEVIADLDPVKLGEPTRKPALPREASKQFSAEDLNSAAQPAEIAALPVDQPARQLLQGIREMMPQSQTDDTSEVLEAARVLLEFHAALRSLPPGARHRRCNGGETTPDRTRRSSIDPQK
jgi:hypothetical protein